MYMYEQTLINFLISKKKHCSRKCSKVKKKICFILQVNPPPLKMLHIHCKYISTLTFVSILITHVCYMYKADSRRKTYNSLIVHVHPW